MIYEVVSMEPGEGDRDVLLEIHYWHDDARYGISAPDFIEHHLIQNVLEPKPKYKKNSAGLLQTVDGKLVPNWHVVDGQWVAGPDPAVESSLIVVENSVEDDTVSLLDSPVLRRAIEVEEKRLRGRDLFAPSEVKKNNKLSALGRSAQLKNRVVGKGKKTR